jgi:hypothetical protein
MKENMRLEVNINLYGMGPSQTRLGINESVEIVSMDFKQISELLQAFHIVTESIKELRNLSINGQNIRYIKG